MEKEKLKFENEYSRQIGAYGMEAMGKLIKMNVIIIGLRGLGIETAKNIILAGPKRVVIYDNSITRLEDLGANFYLKPSDVGQNRRDASCISLLKELNPRVDVEVADFDAIKEPERLAEFNVVVVTEVQDKQYLHIVDNVVRESKGAFIYAAATGLSGFVFTDFGKEHIIKDHDGEECKQYIVKMVSNAQEGVVLIDDSVGGKLAFTDGDFVSFKEVQGMTELNDTPPRPIRWISPFSFGIEDTSKYGEYTTGGIVEQVKVPRAHSYRPFSEAYENPYVEGGKIPDLTDFSKFGRNELLHASFKSLHDFFSDNGRLPAPNNKEEIQSYIEKVKATISTGKEEKNFWISNSQDFDAEIVTKVLTWSACHIVPVTAFMGGIVAQEIVKFTGKFTPINQWMWFDFFESVHNVPETSDRSPKQSRYDHQIAIFGNEIQERLANMNIFMVGAGALGCEFLKEFALMGISSGNGLTTVTDNDHIEISNLNRQFLFRMDNVKNSKSQVACNVVKNYNKDFKTKDLQVLVTPDNSHIFNDTFWEAQDFVINAVDNIKARKYIDNLCTWYGKPLIDSGTLGTKAHSQVIYPHVTNCYNDMQDPPEDGIPMCTLHNFPSMIEHCIEYGRDYFTGHFTDAVEDARKYLTNTNSFIADLKKEGNVTVQTNKLNSIAELLTVAKSESFDKCIDLAFKSYFDLFDHRIRQLLHNFPSDYVDKDGNKFWTGSKRVPSPIPYSVENPLSFSYVATYATIISQALGIEAKDFDYIKNYTQQLHTPQFIPANIKIKVSETDTDDQFLSLDQEETKLNNLIQTLQNGDEFKANKEKLSAVEFEKDDDSNHHIDFMHALSNLRAENYRITQCDRLKTKLIAGKIIPAIATTTAAITGLVALQILTCMQTNKIDYMRGGYINLSVNLYLMTEPGPKIEMQDKENDPIMMGPVRAIPPKFSVWDKIEIKGSKTFRELIDHFDKTYDVEVSIIACNRITLLLTIGSDWKKKLDTKIEDEFITLSKSTPTVNYLVLEVSADCKDGATAILPIVKYIFK